MKFIILCAGRGTRLGSLTSSIPKPLLPVSGKPVVEHIILHLEKNGIHEIGINLHTHADQINNYFKNGEQWGVNLFYSREKELMGTAGALWGFKEWLGKDQAFGVWYGDILSAQNLSLLVQAHLKQDSLATLFVHQSENSNSVVQFNDKGRIFSFLERPSDKIRESIQAPYWANSGIQIVSSGIFEKIKPKTPSDLPADVYIPNLSSDKIMAVPHTAARIAIDSQARYDKAQREWI